VGREVNGLMRIVTHRFPVLVFERYPCLRSFSFRPARSPSQRPCLFSCLAAPRLERPGAYGVTAPVSTSGLSQ
jgi:hypothetical protein